MNKKQLIWTLNELQKLVNSINDEAVDYEQLVNMANDITSKSKENEYVRMFVLDVLEAIEIGYREVKQ